VENNRNLEVSTLTREIDWVACDVEDFYEGEEGGTMTGGFHTREQAEAYARKEGWGFVSREVVVIDEATGNADVEKVDVYRTGGPLVCTRHWEPDVKQSGYGPIASGEYIPASEIPGYEQRKARAKKQRIGSLDEWKARQLSATPEPAKDRLN
jgi:hypothetical protein